MSKVLGIIPCCGFGKRMGMTENQSKEMLLDSNNKYLIEYCIKACEDNNIEPLFLVRKEKEDLIHYLTVNDLKMVIMEPGKEWAETVYNSSEHWQENNILILPDTRWEPQSALKQIKQHLEFGSDVVFAIHKVEDVSKWGEVDIVAYNEKPEVMEDYKDGMAWGLIGFKQECGIKLFQNMQRKGETFYNPIWTQFIFLDEFKDLTRNE